MIAAPSLDWPTANQRYLTAEVRLLRYRLEAHLANSTATDNAIPDARQRVFDATDALPGPSALDTLARVLRLSDFERNVLLLCAAVELDAQVADLVAKAQGGPMLPTFSLALSLLESSHWNALAPDAPLRYWRLVEVLPGPLLTKSALKIDEQILHYLAGVYPLDERLRELLTPIGPPTADLTGSQLDLAKRLVLAWTTTPLPILRLDAPDASDAVGDTRAIAATVAHQLGTYLYELPASLLPTAATDLDALLRLWNREAALHAYALYINTAPLDPTDRQRTQSLTAFLEGGEGLVLIGGGSFSPRLRRPMVSVSVQKPTPTEQRQLWQETLSFAEPGTLPPDTIATISSQFSLSAGAIRQIGATVRGQADTESNVPLAQRLWRSCCAHARPQVDELAQRIEPIATWDDIVLPGPQLQTLREIEMQVRQRSRVYGEWGFGSQNGRGLGISVLFSGESGTGKTMATEVLANALHLDLYRIDLSQVVNKYIGETEKNLRRIFDAAEAGGAILLFDEADALFGKRSEVKDSHDRHSNIEVSYLLQRMEAYRGLAILTTNMRQALDKAFTRRLRFVVPFPYPDAAHRAEIWRRALPPDTPRDGLDFDQLARLNVPGGNIRNIALNAAFIAAHENVPVQMRHLARAARSEYDKLDRTLSQAEIGGF